jgi:enoyl-CoA hydratase
MTHETIRVERRGRVGLVTLDRPQVLNALNARLLGELTAALDDFEADPEIGAVVITGSPRAFAAGADIAEIAGLDPAGDDLDTLLSGWDRMAAFAKPSIAAVAGLALGGGCELAMACDIVVAAETAAFGQPETRLGLIPGAGGTQRLVRAIGKAKAMDLILGGRTMGAAEAERCGLVARVLPAEGFVDAVVEIAAGIAAASPAAVAAARAVVLDAFDTSLAEGLRRERLGFRGALASDDGREGMAAFLARRPPVFRRR